MLRDPTSHISAARMPGPPGGPKPTGPDTRYRVENKPVLTQDEAQKHVQFVATPKHTKSHHNCIAPSQPNQPLPSLPDGFKRQPDGGLAIEAMTNAVIAALDKHKYTYELPKHYSVLQVRQFDKVLACSFQPHSPNDYSVPQITFTESPAATFVWYGNRWDVKTLKEIADHIDHCHAKFERDQHENWERYAIVEHHTQIADLVGKMMSSATKHLGQKFQADADSRNRIFDKIQKAVVDAIKTEVTPLKKA